MLGTPAWPPPLSGRGWAASLKHRELFARVWPVFLKQNHAHAWSNCQRAGSGPFVALVAVSIDVREARHRHAAEAHRLAMLFDCWACAHTKSAFQQQRVRASPDAPPTE